MNHDNQPRPTEAHQAEQSVLGSLLIDNDALDRISDLAAEHFYNQDHRTIFAEICKQILAGRRADVITVFDELKNKVPDCLVYLNQLQNSIGSSANVGRHAELVIDKSIKRSLMALGREIEDIAAQQDKSDVLVDIVAGKVDQLAQRKTQSEPKRLSETLGNYVQTIQDRMEGKIKPVPTGFADLDRKLCGGLDRGTLAIVAGRPGMGKTAFGLGIARNTSYDGSSLFLSMEMSLEQVNDRNVSALGKFPMAWLRLPADKTAADSLCWAAMTHAFGVAGDLNMFIDDKTGLNMLQIRNKARQVKRRAGLDILVIDQLSFITGAQSDKSWEATGEYTRGLLALAKELNIVVILLCQLNRECEKRPNKRPQMADLAVSGSIEQDASTIIFLYRDEVYNPDSQDKGVCEVDVRKQRQGTLGIVGMIYVGEQTRFEDMARPWQPAEAPPTRRKGLAEHL
jgi:replicative DNA helicase